MGEILAIGNIKGGVGKTVLAAQLAGVLHDQGRRVLAIDADPHATLTSWACGGPLCQIVRHEPLRSVKRIGEWVGLMRDARDKYEMVILDLPSAPNSVITTGLMVASKLLMPIGPSQGEIHGSDQTMKLLHLARRSRNGKPELWIIPNKQDARTKTSSAVIDFAHGLKARISEPIGLRNCLAETAAHGAWVRRDKPQQKARIEIEGLISSLEPQTTDSIRSVA